MIFRIRLPRLEEIIGLDSDDGSWHDIARPKNYMLIGEKCTCFCVFTDINVTYTAMMDGTGSHQDHFE